MKRKRASPIGVIAASLALVALTYTLPGAGICHNPSTTDYCRDVISPFPPTEVTIGEETCTMDSNPADDDMVGSTYYMPDGGLYCVINTTYCGVAYYCPESGQQKVGYLCGYNGWFAIQLVNFPQDCQGCPDLGIP